MARSYEAYDANIYWTTTSIKRMHILTEYNTVQVGSFYLSCSVFFVVGKLASVSLRHLTHSDPMLLAGPRP